MKREEKKEKRQYLPEEIKSYLEENFRRRIKLGTIAKDFNINTNELTRAFKFRYHKSIVEYIIELRIAYSKALLKENKITIKEIAHKSGYTTISNFNRQFKDITGFTPAEYRSSVLSE